MSYRHNSFKSRTTRCLIAMKANKNCFTISVTPFLCHAWAHIQKQSFGLCTLTNLRVCLCRGQTLYRSYISFLMPPYMDMRRMFNYFRILIRTKSNRNWNYQIVWYSYFTVWINIIIIIIIIIIITTLIIIVLLSWIRASCSFLVSRV
jgi:hypothetical protein